MCNGEGHKPETEECPAYVSEQDVICFKGKDCVFSNMYPCKLNFDELEFNCSESAYQWRKAMDINEPEIAQRILLAENGFEAKAIARELSAEDVDEWKEAHSVKVMERVVDAKFQQVAEFREELLGSGSFILVEATPNKFWSAGLLENKARKCKPSYYPGENMLGKILMGLRDKHNCNNNSSVKHSSFITRTNKDYYTISYVGLVNQSFVTPICR